MNPVPLLLLVPFLQGSDRLATPELVERMSTLRREIHRHPELGEQEVETAKLVARELTELGLEVRTGLAKTGVVGILRGGLPGRVVAYRADMDALPLPERTGLEFASEARATWEGEQVSVAHACGHDVHVAIALGVARALADPARRARLPGTVVFVFQPAEEGVPEPGSHGAKLMLEQGVFADPRPEAVFALHVDPALRVGQVALVRGGAMAAVDRFTIVVRGKGAHGAYPQNGVDPILAASQVVVALQSIASRNVDPQESVVVTVGRFRAGNRFNIIPETAELLGTIRTHDPGVQELVHARLDALAQKTAQAYGAEATVEIERIAPVTVNDPALAERMEPFLARAVGPENLVAVKPHMGGEDFCFFAQEVPGLYYFLGVARPDDPHPAGQHTSEFRPEEGALAVGLGASTALLLGYLEGR